MRVARRLILPLVLVIFAACTRTVRVVEPLDYGKALTDTTRTFEIRTRDHVQFISKSARVEGDSVLIVTKGYQVLENPMREKKAYSVPIRIPFNNIETISETELARGRSFVFLVTTFLVVLTIVGLHSIRID
jgi:hypothetical protein